MNQDPAKQRYFVIQAVRATGVAMALLGMLVLNHKLAWPQPVGYFLFLAGLVDALFVPTFMARRWKTPE